VAALLGGTDLTRRKAIGFCDVFDRWTARGEMTGRARNSACSSIRWRTW